MAADRHNPRSLQRACAKMTEALRKKLVDAGRVLASEDPKGYACQTSCGRDFSIGCAVGKRTISIGTL
jgi:23S rRNA C2498 (ribose-2'-O)-methylase RlmM